MGRNWSKFANTQTHASKLVVEITQFSLDIFETIATQSSEPGFESPFVTVSKIGHFRSLH